MSGYLANISRNIVRAFGLGVNRQSLNSHNVNRPLHFYVKDIAEDNVTICTQARRSLSELISMMQAECAVIDVLPAIDSLATEGYVFVDVDSFGLIDTVISDLVDLRIRKPQLRVILLSRTFGRDDFTAERLAICDCSLRLPVSLVRLELAFIAADDSNAIWQSRCPQKPAIHSAA